MTPKEKSTYLINKFCQSCFNESNMIAFAKMNALKCVDEIIESYENIFDDYVISPEKIGGYRNMKKYWNEVKNEIQKVNS